MADVEGLAAGIGANRAAVTDSAGAVAASRSVADELSSNLAGLGITDRAGELAEVARQLDEVHARLTGVAERLGEIQQAAAGGGGLPSGGSGSGPEPDARPRTGIPGFHPRRLSPDADDRIRRMAKWPKGHDGKIKARGHLYDDNGVNVLDRTLQALPYGQTYDTPELKEPWRSDTEVTTTWHIEGGAAAYMRRTGMTSATLYLNAPTCGGEDRDPKRCYQNVSKTLPEGSTLTVWSILEDGGKRRVTFRGTGEAITS